MDQQEFEQITFRQGLIPKEMFENPLPENSSELQERILNQQQVKFIDIRQEYPKQGGTYRHYIACRVPEKGVIEPKIALANDQFKRLTVNLLLPFATKDLFRALYSWKAKIRFLDRFLRIYQRNAQQYLHYYYLKPERYCPMAQELRKLLRRFLLYLGETGYLDEKQTVTMADYTGKALATMLEYDVQYRYPLQDFFSSTTKAELRQRPIRELNRIIQLSNSRDHAPDRNSKIMGPFKILAAALWHPKVRRAWKLALKDVEFERLQFDNDDFYFCLTRDDYDYGGLSKERKWEIWKEIHNGAVPPMMEVN